MVRGVLRLLGVLGLLGLATGGYVAGVPIVVELLPTSPIGIGAGLVALTLLLRPRGERVPVSELVVPALGLAFLAGGYVFAETGTAYGSEKLVQMLVLVPVSMAGGVVLLQCRSARAWWVWGLVVVGLAVGVLALTSPDALVAQSDRLSVEGSNTISTGRALGGAAVALVAMALTGARRPVLLLVAAGTFGAVMLATGSRGPVVACVAAILLVLLSRQHARRGWVVAGLIVAGAAAWQWAAAQGYLVDRLAGLADRSAQARLGLYDGALEHALVTPIGSGWGSLEHVYGTTPGLRGYTYPHNILLEVAGEAGWLGLAGLVWLLVRAWRVQYRRTDSPVEAAMLALLVFFTISAMVSGDLQSHRALWVMVGACVVTWLRGRAADDELGISERGERVRHHLTHATAASESACSRGGSSSAGREWGSFTVSPTLSVGGSTIAPRSSPSTRARSCAPAPGRR